MVENWLTLSPISNPTPDRLEIISELRAVFIEKLFFQIFLVFFFQEKQENNKYFQTLGNLQRAKCLERLAFQYLRVKMENLDLKKKSARKKMWKIRTKRPSIRTALSCDDYLGTVQ